MCASAAVQKISKAELKNPKRPGMLRCGGGEMARIQMNGTACGELLGSGPSWWICVTCKKECARSCHAAWIHVKNSEV